MTSPLADALAVFFYNRSQHSDPVPKCWYDSGDYTVFISRNAETTYYLSLAYHYSNTPEVREDLLKVITQQLDCIQHMLTSNYKQFRDMESHGYNLPPLFNQWIYPNNFYTFDASEGRDVYLFLALTYRNLDQPEQAIQFLKQAQEKITQTYAAHCCEAGPLELSANDLAALEILAAQSTANPALLTDIWGIRLAALANLDNPEIIRGVLSTVAENELPLFEYLGGNYDIAGTIALERMYAQRYQDDSFLPVSKKLYQYLTGANDSAVDFTHFPTPYHPCTFFHVCTLKSTLINGVDETHTFDPERPDVWNNTEVQLTGQAKFILAKVMYEKL